MFYPQGIGCFFPCLTSKPWPNAPPVDLFALFRMLRVGEFQRSTTGARQTMAVRIIFRTCKKTDGGVGSVFIGQEGKRKHYTYTFFSSYNTIVKRADILINIFKIHKKKGTMTVTKWKRIIECWDKQANTELIVKSKPTFLLRIFSRSVWGCVCVHVRACLRVWMCVCVCACVRV